MTDSIPRNDPIFHRHDATGVLANDFHYSYYAGTNRLRETGPFLEDRVYDGGRVLSNSKIYRSITVQGNSYIPAGDEVVLRATEKITLAPQFRAASGRRFRARLVQDEDMYQYDAIGNLVLDQAEGTRITWTPYGKVRTVSAQSDTVVTTFRYDGAGNRIEKRVVTNDTIVAITRYLRDASGNVMAIYQDSTLQEQPVYGSNRLGQYQGGAGTACLILGTRRYELSNHLGNVLTVITDNIGMSADTTWATVVSASDYYPFGLTMEGRNYQDSLYRYGFNGKEKDDQGEWGSTNYDYGFRIYSPEIGKFLSVDPLGSEYPYYTPYQFAGNTPIKFIDLDGLEPTSNPGNAKKLIDDSRGNLEDRHDIAADDFLDNLNRNIESSENIHQGKETNFCGPACLASQTFVKNDPVGYVNLMLGLYTAGSAVYNNENEQIRLSIGESALANLNKIKNEGLAGNPADKILLMSLAETFRDDLNAFGGRFDPGDQEGLYASTTFDKFMNMATAFGYQFESIGGNTLFQRPKSGESEKFATENIRNNTVVLFVNGPMLRKTSENGLIGTHYIALKTIHTTQDLVKIQYWDYGTSSEDYKNEEFSKSEFNKLVFGVISIQNPE